MQPLITNMGHTANNCITKIGWPQATNTAVFYHNREFNCGGFKFKQSTGFVAMAASALQFGSPNICDAIQVLPHVPILFHNKMLESQHLTMLTQPLCWVLLLGNTFQQHLAWWQEPWLITLKNVFMANYRLQLIFFLKNSFCSYISLQMMISGTTMIFLFQSVRW